MTRTQHLVFRLAGPFASWGDVGLGNHRPTLPFPTRSGLVGLLGAALGISRDDQESLRRLANGLGFAAEVRAAGAPLRDYHTAQTRPAKARGGFATRREELDVDAAPIQTILTERDYLVWPSYVAAAWPVTAGAPALADLAHALDEPRFAPYLGRRANALALPMGPQVVDAPSLATALATVAWDPRLDGPPPTAGALVYSDPHGSPGLPPRDSIVHWDDPAGFGPARRFAPRTIQRAHREVGT